MDELTSLRRIAREYRSCVIRALASVDDEDVVALARLLLEARQRQAAVYILGNGGSAATASHAATDLAKTAATAGAPPLHVISLVDNASLVTAWANDTCYENVFAAQLEQVVRPGDIVLAISGSGNSENVLRAVETARRLGAITVGLAGFDGGRLRDAVDMCLVVPADSPGAIEDVHQFIAHALTEALLRAEADDAGAAALASRGDGRTGGAG